jgi:predicted nucleotidyltransferase
VALFGSTATGLPRADSDADIAMLGGNFWKDLELGAQLAALLGREPHVVDLAHASDALRFEVARTGILLWQREPDRWALFQARAALFYFDLGPLIERCAAGVRERLRREATHG